MKKSWFVMLILAVIFSAFGLGGCTGSDESAIEDLFGDDDSESGSDDSESGDDDSDSGESDDSASGQMSFIVSDFNPPASQRREDLMKNPVLPRPDV